VAKESVEGLVDGDPEVGREVRVLEDLPDSAKPGTTLGEIVVSVDGERVGETPLVASKGTTRPRCGSRCSIQSGEFFRRRGRG
jgi:hypothetical protein